MKPIKMNGTRAFVAVIGTIIAGLGLGWKVVDSRITSEVRAINWHADQMDSRLDDRAEIFEARVYEISRRLAGIENGQDHMRQQLERIQEMLDDPN